MTQNRIYPLAKLASMMQGEFSLKRSMVSLSSPIGHSEISLRPIQPEDEAFLCHLYGTTRDDITHLDLDQTQKDTLITMQFRVQHQHYTQQCPSAELALILLNTKPIGRLYLDLRKTEIRILDIALLPTYRNQGIGSMLLQNILARGAQSGLPVTLHVLQHSPALRLYQRLGFTCLERDELSYFMAWRPEKQRF